MPHAAICLVAFAYCINSFAKNYSYPLTGNITFQFRYQLRGQRREIKIGNFPAQTMRNLLAAYATVVDQLSPQLSIVEPVTSIP